MITVNNQPMKNFLSHQSNQAIHAEFKRTTTCHAIYHSSSTNIHQRKPYQRKATIITSSQIFFYYLNLATKQIKDKFNSLSAKAQANIQQAFTKTMPTSSQEALNIINKTITSLTLN